MPITTNEQAKFVLTTVETIFSGANSDYLEGYHITGEWAGSPYGPKIPQKDRANELVWIDSYSMFLLATSTRGYVGYLYVGYLGQRAHIWQEDENRRVIPTTTEMAENRPVTVIPPDELDLVQLRLLADRMTQRNNARAEIIRASTGIRMRIAWAGLVSNLQGRKRTYLTSWSTWRPTATCQIRRWKSANPSLWDFDRSSNVYVALPKAPMTLTSYCAEHGNAGVGGNQQDVYEKASHRTFIETLLAVLEPEGK
ncbi:hypothetical protein PENNAL_c0033G07942 [Penicillium nalgiovense]|uniref:Uncharacterized protein n=1 Tax=Penicillium nalgiovense TaxID=60175 RepID=A0A1V6Y761_PENNA|nr:hypothetical protein PENNAL_c0033G07942 [Penicillium nalgiovense]